MCPAHPHQFTGRDRTQQIWRHNRLWARQCVLEGWFYVASRMCFTLALGTDLWVKTVISGLHRAGIGLIDTAHTPRELCCLSTCTQQTLTKLGSRGVCSI